MYVVLHVLVYQHFVCSVYCHHSRGFIHILKGLGKRDMPVHSRSIGKFLSSSGINSNFFNILVFIKKSDNSAVGAPTHCLGPVKHMHSF